MTSKLQDEVTVSKLIRCKVEAQEAIGEAIRVQMERFEKRTGVCIKGLDLEFQILASFDRPGLNSYLLNCEVELGV